MSRRSADAGGDLRVIGGIWRGRRLRFSVCDGLRPTPERVRETLFNWLQGVVPGARCLDLFAGSGALGIEALSRGAAAVVFVERQPAIVRRLRENLALLGSTAGQVEQAEALGWLRRDPSPFDIVFLDPPFGCNLLPRVCTALEEGHWLKSNALIYLETEVKLTQLMLPFPWETVRTRTAGQVRYRLAARRMINSHP